MEEFQYEHPLSIVDIDKRIRDLKEEIDELNVIFPFGKPEIEEDGLSKSLIYYNDSINKAVLLYFISLAELAQCDLMVMPHNKEIIKIEFYFDKE